MTWNSISKPPYGYANDVFDIAAYDRFLKNNDVVRWVKEPSFSTIERFLETGADRGKYYHRDLPPHCDHSMFCKRSDHSVFMIYQPYFPLEVLEEDVEWGKNRGLVVDLYDSSYSWYYPGVSNVVTITLPGDSIHLEKLTDQV